MWRALGATATLRKHPCVLGGLQNADALIRSLATMSTERIIKVVQLDRL